MSTSNIQDPFSFCVCEWIAGFLAWNAHKFKCFFPRKGTEIMLHKNIKEWRTNDTGVADLIQGSTRCRDIGDPASIRLSTQERKKAKIKLRHACNTIKLI